MGRAWISVGVGLLWLCGVPAIAHDGAHDGPRVQLFVAILQNHDCRMSVRGVSAELERYGFDRGEIRRIAGELILDRRAERNRAWTEVRLLGDDCP